MSKKVVAHMQDGRLVKGVSLDVDVARPLCHVRTQDEGTVEVALEELKALYFVKDLEGNAGYREDQEARDDDARRRGSRHVAITFRDGELMGGLMNRYPPLGQFFYVLPIDPESNNIRILVNHGAVQEMEATDGKAASPTPPPKRELGKRPGGWVFDGKGLRNS